MRNHTVRVIGYISSCFREKFGIPRQARLAPSATAALEIVEPFNRREMFRGLEDFSHVWIHFLFHGVIDDGWKETVRPPRLDGRSRKGVFATRSPHRPNHIGLSAVKLSGIEYSKGAVRLLLAGVDLLDGTPVIDIKPYIPNIDSIKEAERGWLTEDFQELDVIFSTPAREFCDIYRDKTGRPLASLIREILSQDPRPASQREKRSSFGTSLWDVNIRWKIAGDVIEVTECESSAGKV